MVASPFRVNISAMVLVLSLAAVAAAQGAWSSWSPAGGAEEIDYRWRSGLCLAAGCLKDIEFRNKSKESVAINYTVWSEGVRDKNEEAKDTGITSVSAGSSATVVASSGGNRVTRVYVERKK